MATMSNEAKLAAELLALRTKLEDFKKHVAEVATRVAEEEGWCTEGRDAALEELGIDPPVPPRFKIEVRRTFTVLATSEEMRSKSPMDWEHFADSSIRSYEGALELDDDWSDVDIVSWEDEIISVDHADDE